MDLTDKIKQILIIKNISPSLFADEIGIQRSSVSHILAGRNKPSLDIIQKIVKRFPELGLNWILDGEELDQNIIGVTAFQSMDKPQKSGIKSHSSAGLESGKKHLSEIRPIQENLKEEIIANNKDKVVERILIFYSDGTFQEFKQQS